MQPGGKRDLPERVDADEPDRSRATLEGLAQKTDRFTVLRPELAQDDGRGHLLFGLPDLQKADDFLDLHVHRRGVLPAGGAHRIRRTIISLLR